MIIKFKTKQLVTELKRMNNIHRNFKMSKEYSSIFLSLENNAVSLSYKCSSINGLIYCVLIPVYYEGNFEESLFINFIDFFNIVKSIPLKNKEVDLIVLSNNTIGLSYNNLVYTLDIKTNKTLSFNFSNEEDYSVIDCSSFINGLNKTMEFTSKDKWREYLNGVLIDTQGKNVSIISSNMQTLAYYETNFTLNNTSNFVIPMSLIKSLTFLIDNKLSYSLKMLIKDNILLLKADGPFCFKIKIKLDNLAELFPKYLNIIPDKLDTIKNLDNSFFLNKNDLLNVILDNFNQKENELIYFELSKNKLTFSKDLNDFLIFNKRDSLPYLSINLNIEKSVYLDFPIIHITKILSNLEDDIIGAGLKKVNNNVKSLCFFNLTNLPFFYLQASKI